MRMIAGAIVTLAGAVQWGVASLGRPELALFATGGGVVLCVVGLLVLAGTLKIAE